MANPTPQKPRVPGPATGDIVPVTDATFLREVVEISRDRPVIVDFWAPWCGPCRQLIPLLEKYVQAAKGKVRLAKVNTDENPGIAGKLGVRSIPAVFVFDQGQAYQGFVGALPEGQVRQFVERLAAGGEDDEAASDGLLDRAEESLRLGDIGGAAQDFALILQTDPTHTGAIAGLARCQLAAGDLDQARETLDLTPREKANDPIISGVRAAIGLSSETAGAGDIATLAAEVKAAPGDHSARYELARSLIARGRPDLACEELLTILRADRAWNDAAAHKLLLRVFEAAGPAADFVKDGRRRLSGLLFS